MYSDKNTLLTKAKDLLKEEMTNISYTTWIKNLEIESVKDNGILGIFIGGVKSAAAGISAAVFFGYIASLVSKPKIKKQ